MSELKQKLINLIRVTKGLQAMDIASKSYDVALGVRNKIKDSISREEINRIDPDALDFYIEDDGEIYAIRFSFWLTGEKNNLSVTTTKLVRIN